MASGNIISPLLIQPWLQQDVRFLLNSQPVSLDKSLLYDYTYPLQKKKQDTALLPPKIQAKPYTSPSNSHTNTKGGNTSTSQYINTKEENLDYVHKDQPKNEQPLSFHQKVDQDITKKESKNLPPIWQERLNHTKKARVIWTYWNLGEDLCGNASPLRRELVQKIIQDLKHPVGTHSFWPIALPENGELKANHIAFWTGVEQLKSRIIIVLGNQASRALGFNINDTLFHFTKHQEYSIIFSKDVDILSQNQAVYSRMINQLRSFLTQYLQIFSQ